MKCNTTARCIEMMSATTAANCIYILRANSTALCRWLWRTVTRIPPATTTHIQKRSIHLIGTVPEPNPRPLPPSASFKTIYVVSHYIFSHQKYNPLASRPIVLSYRRRSLFFTSRALTHKQPPHSGVEVTWTKNNPLQTHTLGPEWKIVPKNLNRVSFNIS